MTTQEPEMTENASEGTPTLEERVVLFRTLRLPGQPMSMHMGTSYLVSDLWSALSAMTKERNAVIEQAPLQGHDKTCHYCGEQTNSLAGNPGRWGIPLCHKDEPGKVKWYHIACVSSRCERTETAEAALAPAIADRSHLHAALLELVALKDTKERIEEIVRTIPDGKNIIDHPAYQEWLTLHAEYNRRKPVAWDQARVLAIGLALQGNVLGGCSTLTLSQPEKEKP